MSEVIELDSIFAGNHISDVCKKTVALAAKSGKSVHFVFNYTHATAQPNESSDVVEARWKTDMEAEAKAYLEHPDRIKEAEEREAVMIDNSATEAQMPSAWRKFIDSSSNSKA